MYLARKRYRGLSMPEMMVAMTVLFIVSTFIMSMFVTGLRQTAQATQNQDLEMLTTAKVSELSQMDFGLLDAQAGTNPLPAPNDDYQCTVAFQAFDGMPLTEARIVEVTVTHPEYGTRAGRTVRCNIIVDPGKAAWEKFGCGSCHSLPAAGYAGATLLPLGPVPVGDPGFGGPRPVPPGPNGLKDYIKSSIADPLAYQAYDPGVEGTMSNFYVEGEPNPEPGDPPFDPTNPDEFIRANSMSQAEMDAMATWITTFQTPP